MNVVTYRPDPSEFAWTFGGVPPVLKVSPGDVLELWTEDAFGGKVRGPDDVSSKVVYRAAAGDYSADLPLDPMHGTGGVAPANLESRLSLVPDAHGGNMDTPEMRAGATCFLGVNVAGALFSLGDGHARQGEGETCGVAVETAMDSVVAIDLIKGALTPWPRIENDEYVITTGSARPLEDAFRIAHTEMVAWL